MDSQLLASLIRRAQQGDREALGALAKAHESRLYDHCRRLTETVEDAEDLRQDTYIRMLEALPRYKHEEKFEAWLFCIATNLARDRADRAAREAAAVWGENDSDAYEAAGQEEPIRPPHPPHVVSLDVVGELAEELGDRSVRDPGEEAELQEDIEAMHAALEHLPEAEGEAVKLRYLSGMSFAEIVEATGAPLDTVEKRVRRGLEKLRAIMEEAA